jgi:hypothetical protein
MFRVGCGILHSEFLPGRTLPFLIHCVTGKKRVLCRFWVTMKVIFGWYPLSNASHACWMNPVHNSKKGA